jgi:hypothetical protein
VRKSCKLVGEANDLLPGAAEQRVWLCKRDVVTDKDTGGTVEVIDLVVEDGARVLVHDELVGTMYMDEHVEARVRLADITGTKAPEMLVDTIGECGVRSLAVMQVDEDGKLQAVWSMETSVSNLESDCGSGDWAGQWDQAWWPQFRGEPTPPKIELADGHFLWASEPMVWVEESKSFVPSQAGLDRYREQEIERVRKLLAEGHPGVAHAILPDDAPKELVRDIEIGCERVFLKALNDAKPINEMGQKANPEEARALKLEMLEYGLQCAPESQALNRSIKSLRAQVEADNKRRALEYEKRAKKDRIALFQRQSLGGIGFGMTRAEVQNLCREQKGRWDGSSSTLVGCDRGPVTFGAGLCGDRVCSIYLSNPSPWRKDLGHQAMLEHYQRQFGEGEHSSAGAAKVVKWKIDARRSIKVTLSHIRGRDLLMVALHSKGER